MVTLTKIMERSIRNGDLEIKQNELMKVDKKKFA